MNTQYYQNAIQVNNRTHSLLLITFCLTLLTLTIVLTPVNAAAFQDDKEDKGLQLIPLPVIGYSPETKMVFGAAVTGFFRMPGNSESSRVSTVVPFFMYTTKGQKIINFGTDLYWGDDEYHLMGGIGYQKFPNKFYGIGNDTLEDDEEDYTPRNFGIEMLFEKRFFPGLYAGFNLRYAKRKISEIEEGGLLASGAIPGVETVDVRELGAVMTYDTRDSQYFPRAGMYHQFWAVFSGDGLGSTYSYNTWKVDLRKYFAVSDRSAVGIQGYFHSTVGSVPFDRLAQFGGQTITRGYYEGRYRDKTMAAFQAEYRGPLFWNLGYALFGGFGDIVRDSNNFSTSALKHSIGWGLRYTINKEEHVNIRIDFGYGKNDSGVYITLGEAF